MNTCLKQWCGRIFLEWCTLGYHIHFLTASHWMNTFLKHWYGRIFVEWCTKANHTTFLAASHWINTCDLNNGMGQYFGFIGDISAKPVQRKSVKQFSATPLNSISQSQPWQCPCIDTRHVKINCDLLSKKPVWQNWSCSYCRSIEEMARTNKLWFIVKGACMTELSCSYCRSIQEINCDLL